MSPYPRARPSNSDFDESTPESARGGPTVLTALLQASRNVLMQETDRVALLTVVVAGWGIDYKHRRYGVGMAKIFCH